MFVDDSEENEDYVMDQDYESNDSENDSDADLGIHQLRLTIVIMKVIIVADHALISASSRTACHEPLLSLFLSLSIPWHTSSTHM